MALDLSLPSLLNSAGALAFVAAGALALRLAPGGLRGRLVGSLAVCFGATYALGNLWVLDGPAPFAVVLLGLVATVGLALAFVLHLSSTLSPTGRRRLGGAAAVIFAVTVICVGYILTNLAEIGARTIVDAPEERTRLLGGIVAAYFLVEGSLGVMVAASALAYYELPREKASERHALALHAAAYGLFASFTAGYVTPEPAIMNVFAAVVATMALAWAFAGNEDLSRNVSLALVGAGLVGLAVSTYAVQRGVGFATDLGAPGIIRTVGAALLAFALLRHKLGGERPGPRISRRGSLTTAALAALLIVAQIAQNFLSAAYGLLMGGLVAGALLVAARPIERALERRNEGAAARGEKLDVFRDAAERYVRDGIVTRDEEIRLARLARHLGVAHEDATRIRHEVEDAARRQGR